MCLFGEAEMGTRRRPEMSIYRSGRRVREKAQLSHFAAAGRQASRQASRQAGQPCALELESAAVEEHSLDPDGRQHTAIEGVSLQKQHSVSNRFQSSNRLRPTLSSQPFHIHPLLSKPSFATTGRQVSPLSASLYLSCTRIAITAQPVIPPLLPANCISAREHRPTLVEITITAFRIHAAFTAFASLVSSLRLVLSRQGQCLPTCSHQPARIASVRSKRMQSIFTNLTPTLRADRG